MRSSLSAAQSSVSLSDSRCRLLSLFCCGTRSPKCSGESFLPPPTLLGPAFRVLAPCFSWTLVQDTTPTLAGLSKTPFLGHGLRVPAGEPRSILPATLCVRSARHQASHPLCLCGSVEVPKRLTEFREVHEVVEARKATFSCSTRHAWPRSIAVKSPSLYNLLRRVVTPGLLNPGLQSQGTKRAESARVCRQRLLRTRTTPEAR